MSGDPGRFFIPATDYSYAATQYGSSPAYVNQIGRVRITAKFDKEFSAFLSGGYESYNLITSTRSGAIYGGGFNWQPQTRTTLSASIENRYYGNSFNVSGSHQTRLSTWKLHASRTDQQLPDRLPESSTASARQTLNELLRFTIPDPTARAQEVERLLQRGRHRRQQHQQPHEHGPQRDPGAAHQLPRDGNRPSGRSASTAAIRR